MTLEELSVLFTADIAPFTGAMHQMSALLSQMGAQADGLADRFASAGADAGRGLRDGLLSQQSQVAAAARALADAAAISLKSALDIHSPSRLTYQVGAFFDQGLIDGIAAGAERVAKEAANLGLSAASSLRSPAWDASLASASAPAESDPGAFSSLLDQALSRVSITVPLEVDGYRLGMAAIEGINRVTQGTGRVELSL